MTFKDAKKIIRKHYKLNRPVTAREVVLEINNLVRRGIGNLDERQQRLAAALNIFH